MRPSTNVKPPEQAHPQTERVFEAVRGWGGGGASGDRISFRGEKNILELGRGDGCTSL